MKYNLLRIDWILLSSLFVVSRFMWTCQLLWVVLPCHVSGIEHYLAISDQLRADLRSCYWGGGEKRKLSSSFLPLPLPFFFVCLRSNFRAITRLETLATQASSLLRRGLFFAARWRVLSSHDRPLFAAVSLLLRDIPDILLAVVRGERENQGSYVRNSFQVSGLTRRADSMQRMIVRRTNKRNLGGMKEVEGNTSCW